MLWAFGFDQVKRLLFKRARTDALEQVSQTAPLA
jgi:hypothetical protein